MAKKKTDDKSNSRTYVVAILPDEVETIEILASSGEQAINLVAADKGAGHYASAPDRNWVQQKIHFEQQAPKLVAQDVRSAPAPAAAAPAAPAAAAAPAAPAAAAPAPPEPAAEPVGAGQTELV